MLCPHRILLRPALLCTGFSLSPGHLRSHGVAFPACLLRSGTVQKSFSLPWITPTLIMHTCCVCKFDKLRLICSPNTLAIFAVPGRDVRGTVVHLSRPTRTFPAEVQTGDARPSSFGCHTVTRHAFEVYLVPHFFLHFWALGGDFAVCNGPGAVLSGVGNSEKLGGALWRK